MSTVEKTGTPAANPAPAKGLSPVASGSGAPGWLFPLYLAGLVLVFTGERVLSGLEKGSGVVTAVGVLALLIATVLRFAPKFKSSGERQRIERLLALLSILGLVALGIYYVTTNSGAERFGLTKLATEKREHAVELLRVLWLSLLTLSVLPQLFAETALRPMRRAERPEARRVVAAALAGGALAMVVIYGSLLVYAAGGIEKKWDYSYFKTSRPGESTKKIAASLSEPLKVVAFYPEVNEVRGEVESYLRELAAGSPKLKVEVRDRLLAPKLARELRATQDGVIILSKGTVTQTLTIGSDLEAARPKLKTLDRDFQEQLLKIMRSKKTVYFTVGHGELNDTAKAAAENDAEGRTANIPKLLLQKQNITVKELGLGQGLGSEVPDDADAVMVLGPTEGFAPEELASLTRFADRGGHLLIALDPEGGSTQNLVGVGEKQADAQPAAEKQAKKPAPAPSAKREAADEAEHAHDHPDAPKSAAPAHLAALAEIAGLKFVPDVLANETQHIRVRANDSDRTRLASSSFSSHASVSTLSRNAPRATIVLFGTGSLEKGANVSGKVDFTVRSASGTFPDLNRNYQQEKATEKTGVFNLAAAVTRPMASDILPPAKPNEKNDEKDSKDAAKPPKDVKEMRAFVIADVDVFSDLVLSNVIGNQVLFVDAARWLVGEESFAGQINNEEDVRIEHTKQQDLAWFYATIFGVPGLTLGAGVLIRRRTRRSSGGAA